MTSRSRRNLRRELRRELRRSLASSGASRDSHFPASLAGRACPEPACREPVESVEGVRPAFFPIQGRNSFPNGASARLSFGAAAPSPRIRLARTSHKRFGFFCVSSSTAQICLGAERLRRSDGMSQTFRSEEAAIERQCGRISSAAIDA